MEIEDLSELEWMHLYELFAASLPGPHSDPQMEIGALWRLFLQYGGDAERAADAIAEAGRKDPACSPSDPELRRFLHLNLLARAARALAMVRRDGHLLTARSALETKRTPDAMGPSASYGASLDALIEQHGVPTSLAAFQSHPHTRHCEQMITRFRFYYSKYVYNHEIPSRYDLEKLGWSHVYAVYCKHRSLELLVRGIAV